MAAGRRLPAALHSVGVQAQAQWQFALQKEYIPWLNTEYPEYISTCARHLGITSEGSVDLRHAKQAKDLALKHTVGSRMACCSEASSAELGCMGARGASAWGNGGGPAAQAVQLPGAGAGCGTPTAQQGVPGSSAGSWQELCDNRGAPGIVWCSAPSGAEDARIGIGADTPNALLMRLLQKVVPKQSRHCSRTYARQLAVCWDPNEGTV